jgi:hypothetical protein
MYKYKTKGSVELVIPGVGVTVDGIITSDRPIENPNLELITNTPVEPIVEPIVAHMTGVVPQNVQTNQTVESEQV